MLSESDFYDKAKAFALLKDTEGKMYTFEEYQTLIKGEQTDKDGNLVYLYATNKDDQYSYIKAAQDKGYSVLLFDGQLDVPCIQTLEQKFEKSRFTRVDADTVDHLIQKEDKPKTDLNDTERDNLSAVFQSQVPKTAKTEYLVEVDALGEDARPVIITQNEWMRRMKEMSRYQSGMSFYGQMPDSFNLVLNSDHRLVKEVLSSLTAELSDQLKPIESEIKGQEARMAALNQKTEKKPEEITQEEKDDKANTQKAIDEQKQKKEQLISDYAQKNDVVHQLIDLALLQNGMLKGEALDKFLKRSVDLIK
jgi:molecular chaperone HtpG